MHSHHARLDQLDLRILERYQNDTQVPARTSGEGVGLSTAAVQRRLERLRELGVIRREVSLPQPGLCSSRAPAPGV